MLNSLYCIRQISHKLDRIVEITKEVSRGIRHVLSTCSSSLEVLNERQEVRPSAYHKQNCISLTLFLV